MASRLIVLRQRTTAAIQAALAVWGEVVTPALTERFRPFLAKGEAQFDFPQLQRVLRRMIETSFERMVAADKAHLDELTNDIAPRLARDKAVSVLRQKLIDIRRIVLGLFGLARSSEIVAVDGATAEQPELLWRQGEHTLSHLRAPDFEMPEASTEGVTFDRLQLADELEPPVRAVRRVIHVLEQEQRAAAATLQAKKEAMAEHDVLISACGRILSGFYLLAGRPDLARRIRTSLPRKGTPSPEPDAEPAADPGGEPADVP